MTHYAVWDNTLQAIDPRYQVTVDHEHLQEIVHRINRAGHPHDSDRYTIVQLEIVKAQDKSQVISKPEQWRPASLGELVDKMIPASHITNIGNVMDRYRGMLVSLRLGNELLTAWSDQLDDPFTRRGMYDMLRDTEIRGTSHRHF